MTDKLSQRFEEELQGMAAELGNKETTKKIQKVWERIGRLKEKHRLVSGKGCIEVEATCSRLKSDLQIHPNQNQENERTESHIYLTILAYHLVNTIRYMLKNKGINHD